MKYMLLICRDEPVWARLSVGEQKQIYEETRRLSEELESRGQYLGGQPLHPSSSATSVRVRDGKPTMMIHCAMHTFQASDEWTDCCGMRTRRHMLTTKSSAPNTWPSPPVAMASRRRDEGERPARISARARSAVVTVITQYTASASSGR